MKNGEPKKQHKQYYLGPQYTATAITQIFNTALASYIQASGTNVDPLEAVDFARSIVRSTMDNDPNALEPDLVGMNQPSSPRLRTVKN